MGDTPSNNNSIAIALIVIAVLAIGAFLYEKHRENQKTLSLSVGGHTLTATVEGGGK